MGNLHEYTLEDIDGVSCSLADLKDKVVLVVNVASQCGLTPQYDGLVRLHFEFRDEGFEIIGFPCNQFLGQEPGSEAEIKAFCTIQYGVSFPLFRKVEVNGANRSPLYAWLTSESVGPEAAGDVTWNFEKFLVGRDGRLLARFAPGVEPCSSEIRSAVEAALAS